MILACTLLGVFLTLSYTMANLYTRGRHAAEPIQNSMSRRDGGQNTTLAGQTSRHSFAALADEILDSEPAKGRPPAIRSDSHFDVLPQFARV